ncbi:MAG: hypothetical protein ACRC2J_03330, partial [Microcoleaceae cyanobacterium]
MTDYQKLPATHHHLTETHADLAEVKAKSDKLASADHAKNKNISAFHTNKVKKNLSVPPIANPEKAVISNNLQSSTKKTVSQVNRGLKPSAIRAKTGNKDHSLLTQTQKNSGNLSTSQTQPSQGKKLLSAPPRSLTTSQNKSLNKEKTNDLPVDLASSQKTAVNSSQSEKKSEPVEKLLAPIENKLSRPKKSLISLAKRKSQLPINQNLRTDSIPKEQAASRLQAVTNKPLEANSLGDQKIVSENKSPVKPANVKSPINNTTKPRTNTPPIAQPESLNISEDKLKSAVNPNIKDNAQTKINYVEPGQTQILPIAGLNTAQKLQSSSQKNPINLAKLPKLPKKIVSSEKSQLIANNVVKNPESGILATSNTKSSAINTNAINTKSAESTIKSPAINTKSSEQKSATPATIKPINQKPSTISQIQPDRLPTEQIRDLLPPPIKQPAKVRKTLKTFGQDLLKVPPVLIPIPPEQNTPIPLLNKQPKPKVTRRDMLKAITNTALRYPA